MGGAWPLLRAICVSNVHWGFGMSRRSAWIRFLSVTLCVCLGAAGALFAQTTISTGSIQGTVVDPQNAVVTGAKVTISNKATGQVINLATSASGAYTSGALIPGDYVVRVEAKGFKTADLSVTVQVGVTAGGSVRMQVGQEAQVVEVQASAIRVNTEQATVQGVLTAQQIDNLPINGRNFLDLAQLEPGVQIQDGGNFDPTKNGFSSISFGGRFGRTARIEVDGIDISDETVGTTTQNIPQGAIQEFQIGQSSLDLSTELTSSGSVNVVTRSGSNLWHGEGFYFFRDSRVSAHLPGPPSPFQRHQFGARVGGPIIKDRLFFFMDGERTKQDLSAPVVPGNQFGPLQGNFSSPFRESQVSGRLDYQLRGSTRFFYRFTFDQSRNTSGFIANTYQPFNNNNHTPAHVVGADFTTGNYTHSIRFGYSKFRNGITDAVTGSSIFDPAPGIELAIGQDPNCLTPGVNDFCSGPNFLAPQSTFQTDKQFKYDGSRTFRAHIIRYGVGYNRLQGGGAAFFLGSAPAVSSVNTTDNQGVEGTQTFAADSCDPGHLITGQQPCFPGGAANPLNFPVQQVTLGNGQGFSSEKPAFGLPGGALGPDNRFSWYIGDAWKWKSNFTINVGLRYVRDTGRTDSDIAPTPCSQLDPVNVVPVFQANGVNCTGNILDLWGAGLGNRVRQPNTNFAPQLGIAWDPGKSGKTVIRAGIGLFYENALWNNNLFNRPPRLQQGLFLAQQTACTSGNPQSFTLPGTTTTVDPAFCGQPIGSVVSDITQLQHDYQVATAAAGAAVNSVFIGNVLAAGIDATGTNLFAPNYRSARSVQMNIGIQREIRSGMVLTVDYIRNVASHNQLTVDVNHVGDAKYLDPQAALDAINATLAAHPAETAGCPQAVSAGASSQAAINCYIAANVTLPQGISTGIADLASNGLDSANSFCGGVPCFVTLAPNAAFPGKNKFLGTNQMLFPIGRSVYNGLQMSLKQNKSNPFRGVKSMNLQVSYAFSRYKATARDTDFINFSEDNNLTSRFLGPNGLDRTHQISFGGTMELPQHFRLSVISHFYSPLPLDLRLPTTGEPGGLFVSDVTGDGTGDGTGVSNGGVGDLLPGTKLGSFGRDTSVSGLNKLIDNYNQNFAGQPTPAGAALINAGVLTPGQLATLGGVQQQLVRAPEGQVNLAWLRALDLRFGWSWKVRDRVAFEPSIAFFNTFNFANFDGVNNTVSGILDGSSGSVNGTTAAQRSVGGTRTGVGTGVFGLGSPRALEFGLRLTF
jgi:hypothetical protein